MYRVELKKADGRALILYARDPLPEGLTAPSPGSRGDVQAHMRWHPLRGEWVVYATHRQHRTFLPGESRNPLAVTTDPSKPTELPAGPWDIAVFENLFPTLSGAPGEPPPSIVATAPAVGVCEVVVFDQNPKGNLGSLPLERIELLLEVWAERTHELGRRDDVRYVFPFENRGEEVGVTLHHPHGQIYAYPFVPPIAARELDQQRSFLQQHGRGLLETHIEAELKDAARIIYSGPSAVAFMPAFARYAYEVWIAPRRSRPSLTDMDHAERADFARAMKTVLLKYDGLWGRPFPYLMAVHQAPTDNTRHPEAHVHIELYPPYRMQGRLKYLASSEMGAGVFTADTRPEEKAAELQAVHVVVE